MGKKRDYGQYFNKANHIGLPILMEGVLYLAEMYYRNLLNVILDFELKSSKNLNKGIPNGHWLYMCIRLE